MNEFLDAICQSLRSVGLEATWAYSPSHSVRLKVAGVEFYCYTRRRRMETVIIESMQFRRPARGAFDTVAAVRHIIERLPAKLRALDVQKTEKYYRDEAKELEKRRGDMEGLEVSYNSRGVVVSLLYADPFRASMVLDFLEENGMQPKTYEHGEFDWSAIDAEIAEEKREKAIAALEADE